MSRTTRTAAALATLALTAGVSVAASPAASAATTRCGSGCTVVSRADVDGDGRADTTTLTRLARGKAYTLRTVTAKGVSASTRVATPWLFGAAPFTGATHLDGAKGAELVLRTGTGAHTQYHAVYTWRSGKLVAEKDPSGSTEWVTDGALSSSMGYTLRTVKGTRQLTSVALGRDSWDQHATFSGTRITARWQHGRWTPITTRSITVPESDAVWAGAGWNVAGLPRW